MKGAACALLLLAGPCLAGEPPPAGSTLPVGDAPAPPVVRDDLADRVYGAAEMRRARAILVAEHGGARVSKLMANLLEVTSASGGGGYRWDAEGWYGGDRDRVVVRTEGEGERHALGDAEVQALWSRAAGRYTDVQAGVRYEFEPDARASAAVAVESLLPGWIKVHAALFVTDRGDLLSRLEGQYDLRVTQRWILQPRAEISLAAQDVPDSGIAAGLAAAELGLRLRYEIRREFAPYAGVGFVKRFGRGDDAQTTWVLGLRAWL